MLRRVIGFTVCCVLVACGHGRRGLPQARPVTSTSASTTVAPTSPSSSSSAAQPSAGVRPRVDATVTIDPSRVHQTIDGFGASERTWDDPHLLDSPTPEIPQQARDDIYRQLFGVGGLRRLRPILDPPEAPAATYDFSGKRADDHIAWVRDAQRAGLTTFFPAPVRVYPWMAHDIGAYVDWATAMLSHWRDAGLEPPLFSPANEPGAPLSGPTSASWTHDAVVALGRRLKELGFRTKLVAPDDITLESSYERAAPTLADAEARQYIAAVAFHLYGPVGVEEADLRRLKDLAATYGKPLWMTEYGDGRYGDWPGAMEWASRMQTLLSIGDVSAIDFLWGAFGSREVGQTLVALYSPSGRYERHATTPVFDAIAQFSRFVRPGCVRVETSAPTGQLAATAFKCPGGSFVSVIVNRGPGVGVAVRGAPPLVAGGLTATVSTLTARQSSVAPPHLDDGQFVVAVPPASIMTVVGRVR